MYQSTKVLMYHCTNVAKIVLMYQPIYQCTNAVQYRPNVLYQSTKVPLYHHLNVLSTVGHQSSICYQCTFVGEQHFGWPEATGGDVRGGFDEREVLHVPQFGSLVTRARGRQHKLERVEAEV